jgi:hypothetical protein
VLMQKELRRGSAVRNRHSALPRSTPHPDPPPKLMGRELGRQLNARKPAGPEEVGTRFPQLRRELKLETARAPFPLVTGCFESKTTHDGRAAVDHFGLCHTRIRAARVRFTVVFLRPKIAAIGAGFYLLAFVCASLYPVFDRRTFSGLIAVLLAWPWIDYLPIASSASLPLAVAFNAITIYALLAVLSLMPALLQRLRK